MRFNVHINYYGIRFDYTLPPNLWYLWYSSMSVWKVSLVAGSTVALTNAMSLGEHSFNKLKMPGRRAACVCVCVCVCVEVGMSGYTVKPPIVDPPR